MKNKIAIITTQFMVDYVQAAFTKMQLDCSYEIFVYKTFRDIPEIYRRIPNDVVGVLTSGSFPARVIQLSYPHTNRVIMPFNTDDAAICQLFFRLLDENRFLKFERIYADVVEMFGIDLKTYLMHDFSTPLSITTNQIVYEKGLEELFQIEEREYQKHLKLWQSGTIDLCVTRFSSIVERLIEQGVPVYFPFPSIGYLRDICLKLFNEIEYRKMQDNSSAIISIAVAGEDGSVTGVSVEYQLLALQAALMEYMGADSQDYFIGRNTAGIEILTSRRYMEKITEHYSLCKLSRHLEMNFQINIGYGVGQDLQQARMNAKRALEKASESMGGASFVAEDEGIIPKRLIRVPKKNASALLIQKTETEAETKKMTVPEYKIREVLKVTEEMNEGQITSQELSEKLGITKRSANRILSAMEEQGVLEISGTRATSVKGRPERIYRPVRLRA